MLNTKDDLQEYFSKIALNKGDTFLRRSFSHLHKYAMSEKLAPTN